MLSSQAEHVLKHIFTGTDNVRALRTFDALSAGTLLASGNIARIWSRLSDDERSAMYHRLVSSLWTVRDDVVRADKILELRELLLNEFILVLCSDARYIVSAYQLCCQFTATHPRLVGSVSALHPMLAHFCSRNLARLQHYVQASAWQKDAFKFMGSKADIVSSNFATESDLEAIILRRLLASFPNVYFSMQRSRNSSVNF